MISSRRCAATAILVMIAGSGCAARFEPLPYLDVESPRSPAPFVAAHCPLRGAGLGNADLGPGPVAGAVPDAFRPATVLRCRLTADGPSPAPDGRLRYRVVVESGPVDNAFLDTLALPDQRFDPADHAACDAMYRPPVFLLLVDRRGRAVRAQLPTDPCHRPRAEVTTALDGLGLTLRRRYGFTVAPG